MLTEKKKEFIEFMMESDVLRFGDFVTKSGRNTPYFVNTGNFRTGKQIATLGKFYAALIKENCGDIFDCCVCVKFFRIFKRGFSCKSRLIAPIVCLQHSF